MGMAIGNLQKSGVHATPAEHFDSEIGYCMVQPSSFLSLSLTQLHGPAICVPAPPITNIRAANSHAFHMRHTFRHNLTLTRIITSISRVRQAAVY